VLVNYPFLGDECGRTDRTITRNTDSCPTLHGSGFLPRAHLGPTAPLTILLPATRPNPGPSPMGTSLQEARLLRLARSRLFLPFTHGTSSDPDSPRALLRPVRLRLPEINLKLSGGKVSNLAVNISNLPREIYLTSREIYLTSVRKYLTFFVLTGRRPLFRVLRIGCVNVTFRHFSTTRSKSVKTAQKYAYS